MIASVTECNITTMLGSKSILEHSWRALLHDVPGLLRMWGVLHPLPPRRDPTGGWHH